MFRRKLKDFAELQKETQDNVPLLDRFKKGAGEKLPKDGNTGKKNGEMQQLLS